MLIRKGSQQGLIELLNKWQAERQAQWDALPKEEKTRIWLEALANYQEAEATCDRIKKTLGAEITNSSFHRDFEGRVGKYRFWYHVRGVQASWEFCAGLAEDFTDSGYLDFDKRFYSNQGYLEDLSDMSDRSTEFKTVESLKIVERCLIELDLLDKACEKGFDRSLAEKLACVVGEHSLETNDVGLEITVYRVQAIADMWLTYLHGLQCKTDVTITK